MKYDFTILEKGNSKGCFVRVYAKKLTISQKAVEKVGKRFSIYTDKKNNVLMLKPDENGRTVTESKSSYIVSGKCGLQEGRYFFFEEFGGGFVFRKFT